ncbi:MAG: secondary thiamine-phosphate synthase enzyme YjbQ [Polyangiaceae bacterium]|nr:secondary thiamine-phosphate synthase enzyme YjbQ [Polyangiaceae bacterium]
MKVHQERVAVSTHGQGLYDITEPVAHVVTKANIKTGLSTVFIQHTSASLVIQENADPSVLRDMEAWIARMAPENPRAYEHDDEGPDDMPGHLRSILTRTSENVPVVDGQLGLGTWQAIYLWEHRRAHHTRGVMVVVIGE